MYCIITHTSLACVWVSQQWTWSLWWSSREQHWNLQLVLQCGLLGQYPLSSAALPPPSLATSLPWLTSIGLLFLSNTCTLYSPFSFFFFCAFWGLVKNTLTKCHQQMSIYTLICLSLSFHFFQHWHAGQQIKATTSYTNSLLSIVSSHDGKCV